MTVDMYHRISLSYTDSPDLRVTWLENLSALQASAGSLEEAAACKLGTPPSSRDVMRALIANDRSQRSRVWCASTSSGRIRAKCPSTSRRCSPWHRVRTCGSGRPVALLVNAGPTDITKDLSIFADASVVQSAGAVFQSTASQTNLFHQFPLN